jgi:hypothetical protein
VICYEITVLRTDGGLYGTAVTTGTGLLDLLSSLPGSRLSTGTAGAVEIRSAPWPGAPSYPLDAPHPGTWSFHS